MLEPRWRKVLRDLWLHRSRSLLVVLAIAVGIVGAGSVLNTWSLLRRVTREEFLASNPASATLRLDSVDATLLERVRALPAIRHAEARRTVFGTIETQGVWRTLVLFTREDYDAARIGTLVQEDGGWPPANGIVVERSSVEFAGIAIGDSLRVKLGDGDPATLPVAGIARDAGLAPGWMEHVVYAFGEAGMVARLAGPPRLDLLLLTVRENAFDRDAIRRVAYQVKALAESAGRRVISVDVPVPGEHVHAGQINSLLFTQGAFGLLALLLSAFLVINLVTAMLAGQVREIGVMKTLGASPGQLTTMYLVVALLLGLAASSAAIPLAAVIGRSYARFAGDLLNFQVAGVAIPRSSFALQLAVGALLPVLAATLPVRRGCRIPVAHALRDVGISAAAPGTGAWLDRFAGLRRPLLLSLRNAFRRRQRMVFTLLALATGGAVFLGALNLREGIRGSVRHLFGEVLRFDLSFRFAAGHPVDSLEAVIGREPGVALVEAWRGTQAAVARGDGTLGNSFSISGVPPDSRLLAFQVKQGRWLDPKDGQVLVVSRRVHGDEPELALGAEVTLVIQGSPSRWRVVGLVETGPAGAAYAPRSAVAAVLGDSLARTAVVEASLDSPGAQAELIQRLRGRLGELGLAVESSTLVEAARSSLEDHLLMVSGFLLVMAQLMLVVGGLGLASTMSLAVLERTRELGVLRAIGARHSSIFTLVQVEGLVIALASWLVAIPLSVPMSLLLGKVFGGIMLPVRVGMIPLPAAVLLWLVVCSVVAGLASAWPARSALRVPTSKALAYE